MKQIKITTFFIIIVASITSCVPATTGTKQAKEPTGYVAEWTKYEYEVAFENLVPLFYKGVLFSDNEKYRSGIGLTVKYHIFSFKEPFAEYQAYKKVYDNATQIEEKYLKEVSAIAETADNSKIYSNSRDMPLNSALYDKEKQGYYFRDREFTVKSKGKRIKGMSPATPSGEGFMVANIKTPFSNYFLPITQEQLIKNYKDYGAEAKLVVAIQIIYRITDCTSRNYYDPKAVVIGCDSEILDTFVYFKEDIIGGSPNPNVQVPHLILLSEGEKKAREKKYGF